MRALRVGGLLCLLVPLILSSGCGEAPQQQPQGVAVSAKGLPELGPYIGPLDERRIEVAPPRGWYVPSRDSKYLIRFQEKQSSTYPTIIVTAEDFESVLNVSRENAAGFAKALKEAGAAEKVVPIEIGSFAGATYRRRGSTTYDMKEIYLDRLFVDTVVAGRKYSFELRTREGTAEQYAPCLYAVARGTRLFKAPGAGATSDTAEKPKPKAEPEAKPETKPEAKPEIKPETKPAPEIKKKTEKKPEKKPGAKKEKESDSEFELVPEKK